MDNEMKIQEAIKLVERAQGLVDEVMRERGASHYEAYGRYGFNQLLGNGNPYDDGLPTILEEMESEEE